MLFSRGFRSLLLRRWAPLAAFALGAAAAGLGAQPANDTEAFDEQWRWTRFDRASGLGRTTPDTSIAETADGTMWAGTERGLRWYDGYFWRRAAGLSAEPVRRLVPLHGAALLLVLQGNRFWIGGREGFQAAFETPGAVWADVALDGHRIAAIDVDGRLHEGWRHRLDQPLQPVPGRPPIRLIGWRSLLPLRDGYWWADARGVHRRANGEDRFLIPIPAARGQWEKTTALFAPAVAEGIRDEGYLAIRYPDSLAGLWHWHGGNAPERVPGSGPLADARAMALAPDGRLVVIHRSGEVWIKPAGGGGALAPLARVPGELTRVARLSFDRLGDLWAVSQGGLHLYRASATGWRGWSRGSSDGRQATNAIALARDGSLWLATGAGVERVRVERGQLRRLESHVIGMCTGVAEDASGRIWATSGLTFTGAWRWDGREWRHFGAEAGLPPNRFHRVRRDRLGRLWFLSTGTVPGDRAEDGGAYLLDSGGDRFLAWSRDRGLAAASFYAMDAAPDGTVYFGGRRGLSRYREGDGWRHWRADGEILTPGVFTVDATGPDGQVYWGDRASGLGRLDPASGRVRYLTTADGLAGDRVFELHRDRHGTLWATSHGGVTAIGPAGKTRRFRAANGLNQDDIWPVASTGAGEVCIGQTYAGLACIDDNAQPAAVRLRIEDIDEKDRAVRAAWRVAAYRGDTDAQLLRTRFRVDRGAWSGWELQGGAALPSLWPGEHRLEVQAEGSAPEVRRFRVEGPHYFRVEYIVPVGLLLALVTALLADRFRRSRRRALLVAERERHYRGLIESGIGGVTLLDAGGRRIYESPEVRRVLGYEPAEMLAMSFGSLAHPDDRGWLGQLVTAAREAPGQAAVGRYRARHRERGWIWLEARVTNRLDDPTISAIILNYRDITAQVTAEEEVARARDEAERASRVKSDFLATMSHEIRTPMNGITGMTSLLLGTALTEEQGEYAEAIRDSSAALLNLVNDVLDISRIEAGRVELEKAPFDLRRVVSDVAELLRPAARDKGITLAAHYPADAPRWFGGDAGRLRQILLNLVGNAVKFTLEGTVEVRVELARVAGPEWRVEIAVSDTGVGIPGDKLEAIFEKFVQADASTTRVFGGTGLGLAICRTLIRLMGGSLWAESTPGRGSTFRARLPLPESSPPDAAAPLLAAAAAPAGVGDGAPGPFAGRRALVAEDNLVNQRVAERLLARLGFEVAIAANGKIAVEQQAAGGFDVILMDCQMPVMDGFEATRLIRLAEAESGRAPAPIIALTANAMAADRERCLAAGMDDFVAKPIDAARLAAAIARRCRPAAEPVSPASV